MANKRIVETFVTVLTADATRQISEMKKSLKSADDWAKGLAKFTSAGLAAIGSGAALLAKQQLDLANEITRLSRLTGESTTEFQRYAAGAKAFGIEQEKLADIFKDTSDKVGDFIQTGGGPLADFFDNIAPKIGVTADQFRNLSGPKALELFVSSLEKANVSQNEMTFFMEAIASDATLLLPLLKDNAAGFKTFGDEAERAGAILSGDAIKSAQQMNATLFLMEQSSDGFKNQVANALLPVMSDLALQFVDVSASGELAAGTGEVMADAFKGLVATGLGVYSAFQLAGKSIAAIATAVDAADIDLADSISPIGMARKMAKNFDDVKAALDIGFEDVQLTAEKMAAQIDKVWDAGTENSNRESIESRIKTISDLLGSVEFTPTLNTGGIAATQTELKNSANDAIAKYRQQAETLGMVTESQKTLWEIEKGRYKDLDEATKQQLVAEAKALDLKKFNLDIEQQLADIRESVLSDNERINASYQKQVDLVRMNVANQEEAAKLIEKLEAKRAEEIKALTESTGNDLSVFMDEAGRNIQSTFSEFLRDPAAMGFDGMVDNFKNALASMVAEAASAQLLQSLANWGSSNAGTGNVWADAASALFGSFASADGGAYTGNGPRSGGLDGKGGFMMMVHPQETIIDEYRGQGAGNTNNITVNVAGGGDERQNKKAGAQVAREVNRLLKKTGRYG